MQGLTVADFSPHLNSEYTVHGGGFTLQLKLVEAAPRGTGQPGGRSPFALLFVGPLTPVLPQATYRFEHPQLAGLDIFIVPVGPEGGKMRYEAIFG